MAKMLLTLAAAIDMRCFQKGKRGPKKPPPKRTRGEAGHYATARVLGTAEDLIVLASKPWAVAFTAISHFVEHGYREIGFVKGDAEETKF